MAGIVTHARAIVVREDPEKLIRFVKLSFLVAATYGVAACGSDSDDGAGPVGPSILADVGEAQETTVGEILANPAAFVGRQVHLSGQATGELGPRAFLFTDTTGEIPLDFPSTSPLPPVDLVIGVDGIVTAGPRIGVMSWEQAPSFTCDEILEVRARFSDPGYVAGNVVGLFLAYRGLPAGEKTLKIEWDQGNPQGVVDEIEVGTGIPQDGLFDLDGVVSHEYAVSSTETKSVRAEIQIVGREGGCVRVRDVSVTKGDGPGFAAGGALRLSFSDPVPSGGFFSVSVFVTNPTSKTGDATLVFSTPDRSSIRTMGSGCDQLSDELVKCTIPDIGAFGQGSEFVQYDVPEVEQATVIRGSVTLVGRDVSPVAQYDTTVEP